MKKITVYDAPSGLGGSFTVSILKELADDLVKVRVWYGKAEIGRWKAWKDWDGYIYSTNRDNLSNKREMIVEK